MSNHGAFSGNPKTEWLVDRSGADRNMRLLEDFLYTDPDGKKWPAPSGSIIDGASIPRPLWATVGSPYTDDYRRASVVHDVACDSPAIPRKDADVMFYHACLAGGMLVPSSQATVCWCSLWRMDKRFACPQCPLTTSASLSCPVQSGC